MRGGSTPRGVVAGGSSGVGRRRRCGSGGAAVAQFQILSDIFSTRLCCSMIY